MGIRRGDIEVVDDAMADILRAKTPQERLEIMFRMFDDARAMLLAHVRAQHPEWGEAQVNREVARRLSHGAV